MGGGAPPEPSCPSCGARVGHADEAAERCRLAALLADQQQSGLLTLRQRQRRREAEENAGDGGDEEEEEEEEGPVQRVHFYIDPERGTSSRVAPVGDGGVATLATYDSIQDLDLIAATLLEKGFAVQGRLAVG